MKFIHISRNFAQSLCQR